MVADRATTPPPFCGLPWGSSEARGERNVVGWIVEWQSHVGEREARWGCGGWIVCARRDFSRRVAWKGRKEIWDFGV